jgi:hypothetical protein
MRFFLICIALCASANVGAAEQEMRNVCSLVNSTEATLTLKVVSGADACLEKRCYASIYSAILTDSTLPNLKRGQSVSFTTSAQIQIGEKYKLFADVIDDDRRTIVFRGAGYDEVYEVPKGVGFYVPIDGAFLVLGNSYYRTVWSGCEGEASECSTVQRFAGKDVLKVDVLAKDVTQAANCESRVP